MYVCTILYAFMYNTVTYPNKITRRGPTWPLAFNLCNTRPEGTRQMSGRVELLSVVLTHKHDTQY